MPPKTSYLASAGKDGIVIMWDLINGKFLAQTEVDCPINVVLFAPQRYWIVLGTEQGVKVWDIQSREFIADIKATPLGANTEKTIAPIACTSLAWNKSGTLLFAGFSDNYIRVYKIVVSV
jgi:guanine nucleotide-binding protein subunit beta-2-like 1 protein